MPALRSALAVRTAAAAALAGPASEFWPAIVQVVQDIAPSVMEEAVAAGAFGPGAGDPFPAMLADALDVLAEESVAVWLRAVL